jgi:hypothetical protein
MRYGDPKNKSSFKAAISNHTLKSALKTCVAGREIPAPLAAISGGTSGSTVRLKPGQNLAKAK